MINNNIEGVEVGDIVVLEVPADLNSGEMVFLSGTILDINDSEMLLFQRSDDPESQEYWFYSRVFINYGKGETNGS